jgi:FKBP-type peptidyl-prolyl cis-trans isomerase
MKITTSLILACTILLASCQQYEKTKDGLVYKITKGSGTQKLKNGDFIKFNLEFKIKEKDTILNSTYGHLPAFLKVDTSTAQLPKHDFRSLLPKCAVGDKLEFAINIDTLKKLGMIMEYNNIFKKGGVINGKVEILKSFSTEQQVNDEFNKELELEKQREIATIEKMLKDKNITAQKTKNGVFVKIDNAGDPTLKVDSGKQVSVIYKGTLTNGKVFDSTAKGTTPYAFVIGTRSVIPGWDEGLRLFGKGGKGKLYIPAMMAYGAQGNPPVIPAYSSLFFDVEIAEVTTPAPAPAQPATPMPQSNQKK